MRHLIRELAPFLRPYRIHLAGAMAFLLLAALATLAFPTALRQLIDGAISAATPGGKGVGAPALRTHFAVLFAVAVALGLASAARYYLMSWLGERVTADLRNAVYAHVLRQSPEFFETTQTGEVLSRLTADTTLVQTVVGSSLSMGLRNAVLGAGALGMLIWSTPYVMALAFGAIVAIVLPSMGSDGVFGVCHAQARTAWQMPAPSPQRCWAPFPWCKATPQKRARPPASRRLRRVRCAQPCAAAAPVQR